MEVKIGSKNKIIIINLLSTIILQAVTFVSAPIFSGALGASNYGIVSVYNTWVSIFSTIFTLQAASTLVIARSNFPIEDQEKYQSSVLSLAVISYMFFSLIILIMFGHNESILGLKQGLLPFALVQGIGHYCVSTLNGKNTYEFRAGRNLILTITLTFFNIGLSLFFVYRLPSETNYYGRVIGQCVAYLIFGVFSFFYIFSKGKVLFRKEYWAFTVPIAFPTIFHLLSGLILGQSDKLMLNHMLDDSIVGIYTLSAVFCTVISSIWMAFNNSWAPFYYEYTRLGQIEEMKSRAKNYMELFTGISCGFILLSPEVFHLFAAQEYWSGTTSIPLFVIGHYFVFLYSFAVNFEFFHKKTKLIARATMIAACANVVLNYFFILHAGFIGAVIATAIAHFLQFVCHFVFAKKYIKEDFPFSLRDFYPGLISITFATGVFYWFLNMPTIRWVGGIALAIYILKKLIIRRAIF